jgi:hypothetical protein
MAMGLVKDKYKMYLIHYFFAFFDKIKGSEKFALRLISEINCISYR